MTYIVLVAPLHCGPEQPKIQTEVLGLTLVRSLAPLTRSLAPDSSLRSRPPLRSLARSLAHFAHSQARGTVIDKMAILSVFFSIFDHSDLALVSSTINLFHSRRFIVENKDHLV